MKYYVYMEFVTDEEDSVGYLCDEVVCTAEGVKTKGMYLIDEHSDRELFWKHAVIETITITGKADILE